ncbi:11068_t:CDS:2 [Paraglomus occultum]|uniref:Calcium-transporting ATPase n=1 Tax=Paraglomus occultum TaxID=144539 RepID=A0A9N8ZR92_9GLOM|nr:11068_t:CDS:2 [Paraglomus occultum]
MSTNSSDQLQTVSEIIEPELIELSTVVANEVPVEKVKKKDAVRRRNVRTNKELVSLISEKDLPKLKKFGGIEGIIKGLQSDATAGLSVDETASLSPVRLHELEGDRKEKLVDAVVGPAKQPIEDLMPADGTPFSQRKAVFGTNILPARKPKSIFLLMWIAMKEKILVLLTIAAIVSLSLGLYEDFGTHKEGPKVSWVEGVAIIVAILIVVLVGSINDWQKEIQFQKLNAKKEDRAVKVIRSGKEELISVHDLLVGDIMFLEPGDVVAADGILISGHNLKCDESAATGESDALRKTTYEDCVRELISKQKKQDGALQRNLPRMKSEPFLLSGSRVLEGIGKFIVTGVGANSYYGKTLLSLSGDIQDTPLQVKLNGLAEAIAKIGGAAALLMLVVLLIKYFVGFKTKGVPSVTVAIENLVNIIISVVTIIVVAIPEGLPLAVTLALAFATTRMLKDQNLVRVLASCETMGNATTVCSDKTGTLTQNKMSVVAGIIGSGLAFVKDIEAHKRSSKNTSESPEVPDILVDPMSFVELKEKLPSSIKHLLDESIAINTTAFEGSPDSSGRITFIGSKTETALLNWMLDLGLNNYKDLRTNASIVQLFPFSSDRKAMGVAVKIGSSKWRFYVKGASEILLNKAQTILDTSTLSDQLQIIALTSQQIANLQNIIRTYALQSLRTIGLGYRDFNSWPPKGLFIDDDGEVSFEELIENITLISIVGIEDPLRDGVRDAVAACIKAGVTVRMVTGDNVLTAKSIATQCGIYTNGIIMEGSMFRNLPNQEMDKQVPKLQVLARSSPEDKRILVAKLRELGEIVAVTGDGTNDGPALKTADVGFSMGISGTEVAKEASSIILMDDDFSSIVKAIMWGRSVNDAVKKFLQFQLTVNVAAVFLTFISAVSSGEETAVLSAVQLLWVNLIMDTFAALALATDPPTPDLLDRKPEPRDAPLITIEMWKMLLGQGALQLIITLTLYYAGERILHYHTDLEKLQLKTLIFNTFVFFQIFNEINCRRLDGGLNVFKGILKNRFFIGIFAIMVSGQFLIIEFGFEAFQVTRLNVVQWAISVILGALSLPFGLIIRLVPNKFITRFIPYPTIATTVPPPETPTIYTPGGNDKVVWNDAITSVRSQLIVFKSLRGGRVKGSSLYNGRRYNDDGKSAFAAATVVPSLVATSVGAGWVPTKVKRDSTSARASGNASSQVINLPPVAENESTSETIGGIDLTAADDSV